jgi:hypothetical protein
MNPQLSNLSLDAGIADDLPLSGFAADREHQPLFTG